MALDRMPMLLESSDLAGASELKGHCLAIASRQRPLEEWATYESCDEFQSGHYCGGFEVDEGAFCFSYYNANGEEFWFTLTLEQAHSIANGASVELELRGAS